MQCFLGDHIRNKFQVVALELLVVVVMVLHYKAAVYFTESYGFGKCPLVDFSLKNGQVNLKSKQTEII